MHCKTKVCEIILIKKHIIIDWFLSDVTSSLYTIKTNMAAMVCQNTKCNFVFLLKQRRKTKSTQRLIQTRNQGTERLPRGKQSTSSVLHTCSLLGGSGGVVNSLDFYPASLKFLGSFYYRWVLPSQWKAVTVKFTVPTLKAFLNPVVSVSGKNLLLVLVDAQNHIYSTHSRSSGQPGNDAN